MQRFTFSSASLPGRTGRGVRVAVVDSGIHAAHPHVQGISGGLAFHDHGGVTCDVVDRLGHGTAVAAAIREKAPGADLIAVKVFDRSLAATALVLANAIRWASQHVTLINLSLGTTNSQHEAALEAAVREALPRGTLIVAAAPHDDCRWLPGAIPGVIAVEADWDIDRNTCEVVPFGGDGLRLRASPYPRPIPGVPRERNLKGVSFAVANATGLLALVLQDRPVSSPDELVAMLATIRRAAESGTRDRHVPAPSAH
jgi:subtilisin family serine protease